MPDFVQKSSEYVTNLLTERLPEGCVYHNLSHTLEVAEAAETIGKNSKLTQNDMEILLIAAWFHDTGVITDYNNHEEESVSIAKKFLSEINYPQDKIEKVAETILATRMPQNPEDLIEEVLCDADLAHIGKKGFNTRSQLLRAEWENMLGRKVSDFEWLKNNIDFIADNRFHTEYAKENFEKRKSENLAKLQKKLRKEVTGNPSKITEEFSEATISAKTKVDKGGTRGIETMFRNVMRTHVEFSALADNKANIMISVNTLLLTAIIAILARKLDTNPHLIIPTAIITIVSLTTLIFATIVTRPKITSGIFTKEDIEKKRANLLFFGNFFRMDLKNFEWGMNEMMNDRDYLYGSMIKDFYFLGQVLGQKYRYLRTCYNIFMYGLILSVIAFTIAIMTYSGPTDLGPLIE